MPSRWSVSSHFSCSDTFEENVSSRTNGKHKCSNVCFNSYHNVLTSGSVPSFASHSNGSPTKGWVIVSFQRQLFSWGVSILSLHLSSPMSSAGYPTHPWKGCMTVPRRLALVEVGGSLRLSQEPEEQLGSLREETHSVTGVPVAKVRM